MDERPRRVATLLEPPAAAVAVFVAGGVLLGVEIAASRVLAPFFGNSLFVWGALIGVVLSGLAVGYWLGGTLADRIPRPGLFAAVLGAGGAAVLAIPFVDGPALRAIVEWDPGPRLNPLAAAIVLFGPASVILAAVTPVAIRLRARSVATVGRTAGRLFALSTAGSIAGTFAAAFWLIPELGTDQLLAVAAAALFAVVALFAATQRMLFLVALAVGATAVAGAAAASVAPERGTLSGAAARNWSPVYRLREQPARRLDGPEFGNVVFAKDTRYHRLFVLDDDDSRYLRFDNTVQSAMYRKFPFRTRYSYSDYFHLGLAYNPGARNLVLIGLGGGSAPKRLWRDFRRLQIQTVELDPVVVDVAFRYFELPRDPRLGVAVADGRRYLATHRRRWDVIAVDAYFSDSLPFHLFTREFLELVQTRLAPGGVVVTNVIGAVQGPESRLFRAVYRTYRSVFPTVLVHPVLEPGDEDDQFVRNVIIVATDRPAPRREFLLERWRRLRAAAPTAPDLRRAITTRHDTPIALRDVPTLTDDYAPTDALLLLD